MRRVVVTGAGAVTPIGTTWDRFRHGLRTAQPGVDVIRTFAANGLPTRVAGEVKDLDLTAVTLPAPERAALARDRKSVFGLVAAREALRQAFGDTSPQATYGSDRIAVSVAAGLEVFFLQDLARHLRGGALRGAALLAAAARAEADAYLQIPAHHGARAIAREAGATGRCSVLVSACAAGAQAIGEAWHLVRDGAADAVIAGGYDSMVNPLAVAGFTLLQALSRANDLGPGASRPFDRHRDGFVLGEGSGMCVLESLEGARARGATVLGEVLGYASTLDAYRVSDPEPHQRGTTAAMRQALAAAGLVPEDIDYINAHGTGTRMNDPAEVRAIRAVFGPRAATLPTSSTKSQIGHLIGAAGAVEFLAGLIAVQEGFLPATINLHDPDPECDLDHVPLTPRPAEVRTFLTNSFGFGGQNATLIAGRLR